MTKLVMVGVVDVPAETIVSDNVAVPTSVPAFAIWVAKLPSSLAVLILATILLATAAESVLDESTSEARVLMVYDTCNRSPLPSNRCTLSNSLLAGAVVIESIVIAFAFNPGMILVIANLKAYWAFASALKAAADTPLMTCVT